MKNRLSRLFVRGVLVAEPAVFLLFNSSGLFLFVLGGRIIPLLAIRAFKNDIVAHGNFSVPVV
jgi:hypothetical protein